MEEIIYKYFKNLSEQQRTQIKALKPLYELWNSKINVISRQDMDGFYERHVLHSLAIAEAVEFKPGETILDVGTGGGFPGIPLAILYPESHFTLCDSIGKKILVVKEVASAIGLQNVTAVQSRAEQLPGRYDYVVSRAVTSLENFYPWIKDKFARQVICLKGGDLMDEMKRFCQRCKVPESRVAWMDVTTFFDEEFFEEKKMIFISR